jgi:hypothetical protein
MNIFKSSAFSTSSVNNKLVNEQGYNAEFDGDKALIKTLDNGKFKQYILDKEDIKKILQPFYTSKYKRHFSNSDLHSGLLHRLSNDYDVVVEPKEFYKNLKPLEKDLKDLYIDVSKIKKRTIKKNKGQQKKHEDDDKNDNKNDEKKHKKKKLKKNRTNRKKDKR